ncbi:hypothetical protein FSP39_003908 [Pinctada imbricata]|uniref:Aminoacyl-transfer RNA synthetases class-II family profile domain-containing protein n=1 Tax=Pinctada imbricata TaxID=66713 RepID=A0AA88XMG0_PINIB|nr:hypothetical protein FSP39_003908 [Pinctada imbricata]
MKQLSYLFFLLILLKKESQTLASLKVKLMCTVRLATIVQDHLYPMCKVIRNRWAELDNFPMLVQRKCFVDVETPTLFRRTPGGAKEFVVPSHYPGQFYSLPQSPQQFKQLLMVGGLDRYFQIARCYRDESIKMDRQPEFTQVDIELSFTTQEEVRHLVEELINRSWPVDKGQITPPFPVITYEQAMNDYGIDKPDTRFDLKLVDISEETRGSGFKLFDDILTKEHGKVVAIRLPKTKKPAVIKVDKGKWESPLSKHLSEEVKEKLNKKLQIEDGDLVFMAAGEHYTPLFNDMYMYLNLTGIYEVKLQDPTKHHFLWVIDFPMFLPKEDPEVGGSEVESAHHPFTAPHPEDQHLIYTHPMKVRSQHYDLVLNGNEIGGGSIRIHNSELQRYVIENILKEDSSELEHLLEALSYGAPPHGGIALGLDRLLAIICEASSIRDVIAFPKSAEGKDHMSEAPSEISDKDLELYHIQVKK